ncbi:TRI33-like protein [Mya arenaria]|uniref:TRI33-like protein n=1 Tax=Mya arenaria TaxID=6604 RepID=A0ABY7FYZ3_MYAAR|nr:pyrin-like [Mya arenaria]WAR26041.1 TRI33-like protein [Mya arenaria]
MASKFDSSLQNSSDLIHDFTCSPCEEDGLNSEAQSFCVECSKYYCSRCEPKHDGLFKRHSVLGRKDVGKWTPLPHTIVDDLERCERHPREALKMFCKDHDQLCCHVCVSVDHRHSSVIQHIPDIARGIFDKPELKQLPQQVGNIQSHIRKLQDSSKRKQQSIKESRARD